MCAEADVQKLRMTSLGLIRWPTVKIARSKAASRLCLASVFRACVCVLLHTATSHTARAGGVFRT